jgi:hypothetical protein
MVAGPFEELARDLYTNVDRIADLANATPRSTFTWKYRPAWAE